MNKEQAKPPGLAQELERLLRRVRIDSDGNFKYPDTSVATSTTPTTFGVEERARLTLALRDTLYTRCYARASYDARVAGTHEAGTHNFINEASTDLEDSFGADSFGAEEFARRLSAANRGRDAWLEGWRVESVGAGGVVVASRGPSLRVAAPGDYALTFAEEVPPCVGCAVTLRVRKETLTLQEGVYCALGSEPPHASEEMEVVRLYFNAPPSASLLLMEAATTHMNEWAAPFTLKVMLRPEDRDRRDASVLYVPRERYRDLFRLLDELPPHFYARLRPTVPLFTRTLRRGVGLAESPATGESFGMHRCRLLAESIVEAWANGSQDAEARLRALEQRFAAEGLTLERAHLNPGSEDVYNPGSEDAHERTSSSTRERARPRAPVSFGPLTRESVTRYLRARGLCVEGHEGDEADEGDEGDEGDEACARWRVAEHHSRNRNFEVTSPDGSRAFFVKQLRAQDPESFAMLRREARVYELARDDADFAALREVVPPFFGFDAAAQTTVLGALGGESLLQLQRRLGRFPTESGEQLGRALATVHARVGRASAADPPRGVFNLEPPGVLSAHRNGALVRWLGPGQLSLVELVREDTRLSRVLDDLASTWRRDAFIHGDVKFENCVVNVGASVLEESAARAGTEIRLVDWELADFGEAAWDVGSAVQAYLALCMSNSAAGPGATSLEQLQAASAEWQEMRRAVAAFWRAYTSEAAHDEAALTELLERTLLCAAARLVQTALEVTHGHRRPTPLALSLLAAGVEVSTRTREAVRLLGLSD
jgi:HopA1 effector protein family/Phosphotransferase enzyme family